MGTCLKTQLKAAVNNPNLPVFETIQQFTLDAITASGNSSMTDAQKWALNHFFFQIGAIDNDGIYAKMKYLFIPMICNNVATKILVNYKGNVAFPTTDVASYVSFDEYGCIYKSGSAKRQELTASEDTDGDDLFVAMGTGPVTADADSYGTVFRAIDSINDVAFGFTANSVGYFINMNGIGHLYDDAMPNYGYVSSRYNNEYQGVVVGTSENHDDSSSSQGTEVLPTSPYSHVFQIPRIPVGLFMWGSHLTSQEMTTLANAIRGFVKSYLGL